jgi:hypothetical protein
MRRQVVHANGEAAVRQRVSSHKEKDMIASWKSGVSLALATALVVVVVVGLCWQPALAQKEGGATGGPRYSVIDTEGHNLIVTDNQKNTLYFYTIDKDAKIGSDLKLRGTVDLSQVGEPVIKPSKAGKTRKPKED